MDSPKQPSQNAPAVAGGALPASTVEQTMVLEIPETTPTRKLFNKVIIRSMVSNVTKANLVRPGQHTDIYPREIRTNVWDINCTLQTVDAVYPELANDLTKMDQGVRRWNRDFIEGFLIRIPDKGLEIEESNDMGRLQAHIVRTHPAIGKQKYPETPIQRFFMYDEIEEADKELARGKKLIKALTMLDEIPQPDMVDLTALYGFDVREMTAHIANAVLSKEARIDPDKFLGFMKNRERTRITINVRLMLLYQVLKQVDGRFMYEEELIGSSEDGVVDYFANPHNQQRYIQLRQYLEQRRAAQ